MTTARPKLPSAKVRGDKCIGRATNIQSKQKNADTGLGERNGDKEAVDEWKPSTGVTGTKTRKATHKYIKKNAPKTKKLAKNEPLACPWPGCDARLARKDHLKRHIAAHTDGKPFRCPAAFCSYAAKRQDNLAEHLKLRHKLSVTATRKSAAGVAKASRDEIRSLARAVEAAINAATSIGDAETGQCVAAGSKRKNKDHDNAANRSKKRTRISNSTGATEAGAGESTTVD